MSDNFDKMTKAQLKELYLEACAEYEAKNIEIDRLKAELEKAKDEITDIIAQKIKLVDRIAELEAEVKRKNDKLNLIFAVTDKRYPDGGSADDILRVIEQVRKDAPKPKEAGK